MRSVGRPPLWFWSIPLLVAALRMLPVLSLRFTPPPEGQVFLRVSYLPKDFLQYAAFSRQVVVDGSFFFYNPFTTEPQDSRFILLFHWLVGLVARVSGLSAIDVLEWSRIPLLFLFFATLWWFLRPILADRTDRLAASVLVGFAGGLEGWVRPLGSHWLPKSFDLRLQQDTSALHGWSVFASSYNPLWIAGLILALVVLRPLLFSGRSKGSLFATAAAFAVLFFVHPYTALGVAAITAMAPVLTLLVRERPDWRRQLTNALVLGAAGIVVGGISLWQLQDPVYRRSTGGVFGAQNLSALWYPLTLGLLGGMACVGARRWLAARHPARAPVLGWIAAVCGLHWLPILNGYKFVFLLPLPLCILAAPVVRDWLDRMRGPRPFPHQALALFAGVALFGGSALQTIDALRTARSVSAFPSDAMRVVELLAAEPAANALAPAGLGNVLPAFSAQRVWVGHWFLTPDYFARDQMYRRFTMSRAFAGQLRSVVREQRIRHLVVPTERSDFVLQQLGEGGAERRSVGSFELLRIR